MTWPQPWLPDAVMAFIDRRLHSNCRIFEWGAGGSTLHLAPQVAQLISVEHDREWHGRVQEELKRRGLNNVVLELVEADPGRSEDILNLETCASYGVMHRFQVFRSYAQEIRRHEGYFNFILVDGRARIGCLKQAQGKVKPGGYVMLDDSDRHYYAPGKALFTEPEWEPTVVVKDSAGCTTHFWKRQPRT